MTEPFILQLTGLESGSIEIHSSRLSSGERRHVFQSPFCPAAQLGLLKVLEKYDLAGCKLEAKERDALTELGIIDRGKLIPMESCQKRIGQKLFEALFPRDAEDDKNIYAALRSDLDSLAQGDLLPIQLRFYTNAVSLASLPWELIYDGQNYMLLGRASLTRYIAFGKATQAFPVSDRLSILVVSPRPVDLPILDQHAETHAIEAALSELEQNHCLSLKVLNSPTWPEFVSELGRRTYQIVHFDGHGSLGRKCSACNQIWSLDKQTCECGQLLEGEKVTGCLAFERGPGDKRSQLVTSEEIGSIISRYQVRMIVASACRSTMLGGSSVFNSLGPRMIQSGVPAVVGMQFNAPMASTIPFMKAFYEGLGNEKTLVECMATGREVLGLSSTWFIPTLYLRNQDGQGHLFRFRENQNLEGGILGEKANGVRVYIRSLKAVPLDLEALQPKGAPPFLFLHPFTLQDAAVFFGRKAESLDLYHEVIRNKLVVLHGQQGVGKTSLINAGLIPKLLDANYLTFVLEDSRTPFQSLKKAVEALLPEVNLDSAVNLASTLQSVQREIGRPLVVVMDELNVQKSGDDMIRQISDCMKADFGLHICFLIVVSDLTMLSEVRHAAPKVFQNFFRLDFLEKEAAIQAIQGPLEKQPFGFEDAFLHNVLLPDLYVEPSIEKVNPSHLQIICHALCQQAVQNGTKIINEKLYASNKSDYILKQHLDRILLTNFPQPDDLTLARELLQQLVDSSGKRVSRTAQEAAQALNAAPEKIDNCLQAFEENGIISRRAEQETSPVYAFSHHLLAKVVFTWRDPQRAMVLCAQDTLDRAWEDWYSHWWLQHSQEEGSFSLANMGGLIGESHLHQIRAYRESLTITPAQLCLLLHNAVVSGCDMEYWAGQFREPAEKQNTAYEAVESGPEQVEELVAQKNQLTLTAQAHAGSLLLRKIQDDGNTENEDIQIGAAALGLGKRYIGEKGLARAAISAPDGAARHTAVLAITALGQKEMDDSRKTLVPARPRDRHWQHIQALANMQAAGFQPQNLPFPVPALVRLWIAGTKLFNARWKLIIEPGVTALSTGWGYTFVAVPIYALSGLAGGLYFYVFFLFWSIAASLFALGRLVGEILSGSMIARLLGGSLGMAAGMLIFLPAIPKNQLPALLNAALIGAAIGLGWEYQRRGRPPVKIRRVVIGAGLACALLFAALEMTPLRNTVIDLAVFTQSIQPDWLRILLRLSLSAITGFVIGASTAGGNLIGSIASKRWSTPSSERAS